MSVIIFTFLLTGLLSGFLAGLLGVGGGIIIVPVCYYVLIGLGNSIEIAMHVSIASSLAVIVLTSISSIRSHLILDNVESMVVKKWFSGIIAGSLLGSFLASKINGEVLVIIFVSLAFLISVNMFFQKQIKIFRNELPKSFFFNFFISGNIGLLSSLIGIGGGSFSVPTLSFFSKPINRAVGTSSVLGLIIALPATISYMFLGLNIENLPNYSIGYVNPLIVVFVASTSIFSANIGAKISSKINKDLLKKIFAIFLLCTCVSLVIEHFIIL